MANLTTSWITRGIAFVALVAAFVWYQSGERLATVPAPSAVAVSAAAPEPGALSAPNDTQETAVDEAAIPDQVTETTFVEPPILEEKFRYTKGAASSVESAGQKSGSNIPIVTPVGTPEQPNDAVASLALTDVVPESIPDDPTPYVGPLPGISDSATGGPLPGEGEADPIGLLPGEGEGQSIGLLPGENEPPGTGPLPGEGESDPDQPLPGE